METTHPILAQKTETIKPLYHFKRLYTKIPHASEVNIIPHLEISHYKKISPKAADTSWLTAFIMYSIDSCLENPPKDLTLMRPMLPLVHVSRIQLHKTRTEEHKIIIGLIVSLNPAIIWVKIWGMNASKHTLNSAHNVNESWAQRAMIATPMLWKCWLQITNYSRGPKSRHWQWNASHRKSQFTCISTSDGLLHY